MSKKLLVINADQWMEVQFDQQMTIGRDVFNALSLQDIEVSRSHAIIFEQDGETIVKDLNSRNGIYVHGERASECTLRPGDEVILGSTVIIFEPNDSLEIGHALSRRGRYLVEKRLIKTPPQTQAPETVHSLEEMDHAIESLFANPESTTYFSMSHALVLLQAIKEIDDAPDAAQLFETTLCQALGMLGGHRAVIMQCDEAKQHLKVRSLISADKAETIMIGQPILRVLLGSEKCIYCPNIKLDKRFEHLATKCRRPIHSFVASPIRNQAELFGFIYLDSEDSSLGYDFAALRSLYFIAFHLGALLRRRPLHPNKHAQPSPGLHLAS